MTIFEYMAHDVCEWLCTSCNTCYPGPPQEGVKCVICPKCGGDTMSRARAERVQLKEHLAHRDNQLHRIRSIAEIALSSKAMDIRHILETIQHICDQPPK
jgi:hypothetical protein